MLSDPGKETAGAYGVLSERGFASRWTFYIDGGGVIRRIDKEVSVRTAGEDILRQLKELGLVE